MKSIRIMTIMTSAASIETLDKNGYQWAAAIAFGITMATVVTHVLIARRERINAKEAHRKN